MSSINCLNASFCSLTLCTKYKLIDHIVNNIQLTQNLTCVFRTKRICNSMVKISKYVVMFNLLSKVVVLGYNKICN